MSDDGGKNTLDVLESDFVNEKKESFKTNVKEIAKILGEFDPIDRDKILTHFLNEVDALKELNADQRKKFIEVIKKNAQRLKNGKNPTKVLITWKGFSAYTVTFLSLLFNAITIVKNDISVGLFFSIAITLGGFISYKITKCSLRLTRPFFEDFHNNFIKIFSCKFFCYFTIPVILSFVIWLFLFNFV